MNSAIVRPGTPVQSVGTVTFCVPHLGIPSVRRATLYGALVGFVFALFTTHTPARTPGPRTADIDPAGNRMSPQVTFVFEKTA